MLQKLDDKCEDLQISMAESDHAIKEVIDIEEKLDDRVAHLEEEVVNLKASNNELRKHLNLTIKELNAVIYMLNPQSTTV